MDGKPGLLDQLREQIRVRHYSIRTEDVYVKWVRDYVRFHGLRHPSELGAAEVEQFLSHLAVRRQVSASTQNQALSALLFLYKHVLHIELPWLDDVVRAKRPERLPVVLTREETQRLLALLEGEVALVAGLRLQTCGAPGGADQAGDPAYVASLLRHPSAGKRPGHSHGAGAARACGCEDHADLYPCAQPRRSGGVESAGSRVAEGG